MNALYSRIRPLLFQLDPETAHGLSLKTLKTGMLPKVRIHDPDQRLETTLWGLKFPSPVGLAAGFDKNAEAIGPCLNLGFGFVEAGTVTPRAQPGNPRPRIFRDVTQQAIINRMGFPNAGAHAFKSNLERFLSRRDRPRGVVGVNIGMNKGQSEPVRDYAMLINLLAPMADYLVVNISSPNTPGLRSLQQRAALLDLIGTLKEERSKACGSHGPPLLVKLAPDLTPEQQQELAETALETRIDGLILTNTTLVRPEGLDPAFAQQAGGLSGQPLTRASTDIIRNFYRLTEGKIPIIGVGGVASGRQVYDKIKAGASLVQLYTGLVYEGPGLINSINQELLALLRADGYNRIHQAVGILAAS